MKKAYLGAVAVLGLTLTTGSIAQQDTEQNKAYPHKIGNLLMSDNYLNFNYLKDTEDRLDTIRLFNSWDRPMEISPEKPPKHIEVWIEPQPLPAGSEALLIVKYYGTARPDYGFVGYRLGLRTNDMEQMIKTIPVNAYIEEDFSGLTEEQKANPPRIEVQADRYNFGTVKEGTNVAHDYVIKNVGSRDLIIRSTRASCGCTAIKPEKTVLAPGEESKVGIVLDTRGRKGMQHKTVSIISNDPRQSTIILHVEGQVE
jgi:hypothetical protein